MSKVKAALMSALLVMAVSAAPVLGQGSPAITSVVAFGDSYSDDGFADGAGFKRYTETLTWVERLAAELKVPLENLAWGGAMSDQRNCNHPEGVDWSGLQWQVDRYLAKLPAGQDLSGVLFTVMVGSNDAWGGVEDGKVSAANIKEAIEKLAARGAKRVLYVETSAVLLSPGYLAGDYANYAEPWTNLVNATNEATRESIAKGLPDHPDLKIGYVVLDELMERIKKGEAGYKFENLTEPWWGTYSFPEPGKYLWYDEWHPMGLFHELAAKEALAALKKID